MAIPSWAIPTVQGVSPVEASCCATLPLIGSLGSDRYWARLVAPVGYQGRSRKSVWRRYARVYGLSPSKLPSDSFSAHMPGTRVHRYSMNWPYWYGLIRPWLRNSFVIRSTGSLGGLDTADRPNAAVVRIVRRNASRVAWRIEKHSVGWFA